MSRKRWDEYDDYDSYDNFSDYDFYYGSDINREYQRGRNNSGGGEYQRNGDHRGGRDHRNDRFRYGAHDSRRFRTDQDEYGGNDRARGNEEVGSGVMYLLMTLFFAVLAVSVILGKMTFNKPEMTVSEPDSAPVSSMDTAVSSETMSSEEQKIEDELVAMTLEQKVGQLFMVRNNGKGSFSDTLYQTSAGGVILFANDFKGKTADDVRDMISGFQADSDGRMFVAVDEEGGTVVRVSSNPKLRSSKFLSPQRLYAKGGFDLIISDTQEKCELLNSLGINMNMAPVADVCTSSSAFMYKRAFGKGAEETAEYVAKVIDTMGGTKVASCVKHFPGYGNSKADTHKGLDVNDKSLEELKECDLIPFEAAIRENVDAIMLTHTVINAVDEDHPASLSKDVVEMLRGDMGFDGLLITDGLEMGAVIEYSGGDSGKVCVMAVLAGVDILCDPKNPVSDYNAVLEAVRAGDISESQIDDSVRRIIRTKIRLGLYE